MKKLILLAAIAFSFVSCTAEDVASDPCGVIISKGWTPGVGTYITLDTNPSERIYCKTEELEGGDIYCR